jgi:TatD DNase family protein
LDATVNGPPDGQLVDSHVHLDRFADPDAVLARVEADAIQCVSVTETPSHYLEVAARLAGRSGVGVALGVHPLHAAGLGDAELALFDRLVDDCAWVGEVGLDGSAEGMDTLPAQREALQHVLGHPAIASRVLTVHSRGAEAEVVDMLARAGATAVLHWYRGDLGVARAALDAGLSFSINPAMIATDHGVRLIDALAPESVLVETDGPYTEIGGRPATPSDVPVVLEALAERWGLDPGRAREQVWRNFIALGRAP